LANLPQFLCRSDDIVLTPKRPGIEFLSGIKQAGFPLPEFVELKDGEIDPASNLVQRKIGSLRPWAWGPDSMELLQPLFSNVTGETRSDGQRFNDGLAQLYSKAWSADFLKKAFANFFSTQRRKGSEAQETETTASWLCAEHEIGTAVNTLAEALGVIAAIRQRGHHPVVAKQALGLAGQNALRFWEPELLPAQKQWLEKSLQNGQQVVIEPWLERELDFSIQFEMESRRLKLCGYTGLINDGKGQFQANVAEANFARRLPANVTALFREVPGISNQIQQLYQSIFSLLERELRDLNFMGPVGLDAFVYRTADGGCKLKPIVEINPRYTMGRLTVELMKQTCPGSRGEFRIVNQAQLRAKGFADFSSYADSLKKRFPLRLEGEPIAKILEGTLCLNEPNEAQVCLATFQVRRNAEPVA
jgi:hypothetical protein